MPRKSLLAEAAEALVSILPKMKDPQHCKPGDLVRALNSTPAGEVLTAAKLRGHRDRAGLRIGDGKTIDLFRYVAWLATEWEAPVPAEPLGAEAVGQLEEIVLHTRAEAAEYFGVDERTIAKWMTQAGFPGNAGTRGQRNGYFPARAIGAWRDGRRILHGARDDEEEYGDGKNIEQAGLIRAKRQLAELDLAERTAQLVDAEEVTGRMVRLASEAAAVLRQLPAEIVAQMPEEIESIVIARMRELARLRVEQALRCLAEAARTVAGEEEYDDQSDAVAEQTATPERAKPKPKSRPQPKPRRKPGGRKKNKGRSGQRAAKRK